MHFMNATIPVHCLANVCLSQIVDLYLNDHVFILSRSSGSNLNGLHKVVWPPMTQDILLTLCVSAIE